MMGSDAKRRRKLMVPYRPTAQMDPWVRPLIQTEGRDRDRENELLLQTWLAKHCLELRRRWRELSPDERKAVKQRERFLLAKGAMK